MHSDEPLSFGAPSVRIWFALLLQAARNADRFDRCRECDRENPEVISVCYPWRERVHFYTLCVGCFREERKNTETLSI